MYQWILFYVSPKLTTPSVPHKDGKNSSALWQTMVTGRHKIPSMGFIDQLEGFQIRVLDLKKPLVLKLWWLKRWDLKVI